MSSPAPRPPLRPAPPKPPRYPTGPPLPLTTEEVPPSIVIGLVLGFVLGGLALGGCMFFYMCAVQCLQISPSLSHESDRVKLRCVGTMLR